MGGRLVKKSFWNQNKLLHTVRVLFPPVFTITASIGILSGAVWIHDHQQQSVAGSHATPVGYNDIADTQVNNQSASDTLPSRHAPQPGKSGASPNGHTSTSATASQKSTRQTQSSKPQHATNSGSKQNSQAGDIGFTPVSGGTVTSISTHQAGFSTPSCVVIQYGSSPQTTWKIAEIKAPSGAILSLPKGVNINQILALQLKNGIIWSIIPPTQMGEFGNLEASIRATPLYFTPYPSSTQPETLLDHAILLGNLPIYLAQGVGYPAMGWYHPQLLSQPQRTQSGRMAGQNLTLQTTVGSAATPSINSSIGAQPSAGSPTNNAGNMAQSSTQIKSQSTNTTQTQPTPKGALNLYLQGFYQTSTGAIIVVSASNSSTTNQIWVYAWNATDKSLNPITALTNGNGTFSWLAITKDLVYFGTRHVLAPDYRFYEGSQHMFNVKTLKTYPIHLGTWTSEVVPYQNDLQFRVKQSVNWMEFHPSNTAYK
jgi:hypothetical protein